MTLAAHPTATATPVFGDDEPVFAAHPDYRAGVAGPVFGQRDQWPADAIRRPSNRCRGDWKLRFPGADPVWNLRTREVCFALLNPTHRALREAGICLPAQPAALRTVTQVCAHLTALGRWALRQQMPTDLRSWTTPQWQAYLDAAAQHLGPSSVTNQVAAIRRLVVLAPILTHGGPAADPWPGRTAADIGQRERVCVSTPSIPPTTWWPLLRAAWTYIHVFAPDILALRERAAAPPTTPATAGNPTSALFDRLVQEWVANPDNLVPVHATDGGPRRAGTPRWATLSKLITGGASDLIFTPGYRRNDARRALVDEAVAAERVQPGNSWQPLTGPADPARTPGPPTRSTADLDTELRRWLANPDNLIPVHPGDHPIYPGAPRWAALARQVWGTQYGQSAFQASTAGLARRRMVTEAATPGRVYLGDGRDGPFSARLTCAGFAVVTHADGTRAPWRDQITPRQLDHELRMIRAACYIFVAAMSMMRDSEIQEIERAALTTHYGFPALTSRKTKRDPAQPQLRWWITEPVAQAIKVAERASRHPTHLFATLRPPPARTRARIINGRRGINAASDIEAFIAHVNTIAERTGLAPIPSALVRPHMFRRTMSIITGQEPDAEIALGLQLKHAARRALANRSTPGYAAVDTNWANQFDTELEIAAAKRLAGLLHQRRDGTTVAVGPAAGRLHTGLDNVNAAIDQNPGLQAHTADARTEITLLRDEFTNLHLGTINHCLWNAANAECQNSLPPEQRGHAPLIGACQPARCRNSAITATHAPIWLAEQADLTERLRQPRLAPPYREALRNRLADVRLITDAWLQKDH